MTPYEEDVEEVFGFGAAGDPAHADRSVEVTATDSLQFEPPSIDVSAGGAITFFVSSPGQVPHEFVIGDATLQADHTEEMRPEERCTQRRESRTDNLPAQEDPRARHAAPLGGMTFQLARTVHGH